MTRKEALEENAEEQAQAAEAAKKQGMGARMFQAGKGLVMNFGRKAQRAFAPGMAMIRQPAQMMMRANPVQMARGFGGMVARPGMMMMRRPMMVRPAMMMRPAGGMPMMAPPGQRVMPVTSTAGGPAPVGQIPIASSAVATPMTAPPPGTFQAGPQPVIYRGAPPPGAVIIRPGQPMPGMQPMPMGMQPMPAGAQPMMMQPGMQPVAQPAFAVPPGGMPQQQPAENPGGGDKGFMQQASDLWNKYKPQ